MLFWLPVLGPQSSAPLGRALFRAAERCTAMGGPPQLLAVKAPQEAAGYRRLGTAPPSGQVVAVMMMATATATNKKVATSLMQPPLPPRRQQVRKLAHQQHQQHQQLPQSWATTRKAP